jgi:hypothetical protein
MAAAIILIGFASPARADSLQGRLAKMPAPEFATDKNLDELEFCIGVGLGKWLIPKTLHGDRRVFLYTGNETEVGILLVHSVLIVDDGEQRTVSYYSSKGWNDRLKRMISSCV